MVDIFKIPTFPGCYLYKDKDDNIIYIGKAKNLKKRVSSYFHSKSHDSKTRVLVKNIASVDFIVTDSEIESLILEARLIRQHKPKFNIDLKEGERYAYILITDEKFPKIVTARQKTLKGTYFGPYTDGTSRKTIIEMLQKIFLLRVCNIMPKKECLYYHIGKCSAPCVGKISQENYKTNVDSAISILKGNIKDIQNSLTEKMHEASKNHEFERALIFRNQIRAIESLHDKQKIESKINYDQDIIVRVENEFSTLFMVFNIKKGIVYGKEEFRFERSQLNAGLSEHHELIEQFIELYYSLKTPPDEIFLDDFEGDLDLISAYLFKIKGKKVDITVPKIGLKRKLVEMVQKNAVLALDNMNVELDSLKSDLNLIDYPEVIEAFDISNLGSSDIVSAMVQFKGGKPNKSEYRKFNIKSTSVQDDFASMRETILRRYGRLKSEGRNMPDLILIDGGKGQLSAAISALTELELDYLHVISLAKQNEEIFFPDKNEPLVLDKNAKSLLLLRKVRDEVHRFVITFQKSKRLKSMKR